MVDHDDKSTKKPPRRSLGPALERQHWVREHLGVYVDRAIDVFMAKRLAAQLNTASDDTMPYDHLFETFAQYEGRTMTPAFVEVMAMQIAGREDELVHGPLMIYSHPVREEWVPLEVVDVQPTPWRDGAAGQELTFLALGGHPSGHTLRKKVPESWLTFLAYQIGFSQRSRYADEPWMLIGLRLWGYLVPDEDHSILQFTHWGVNDELKSANSKIVRYRVRFLNNRGVEDPFCPMDFDHDCNVCTVRSDKCPGAVIRPR